MTPGKPQRVYLGLGSNVGNRPRILGAALKALNTLPTTKVLRASPFYESSPVGPAQRDFLNAVVALDTHLSALALLKQTQALERQLGRQHRERWGPREIDIDILFYGEKVQQAPRLTLPHPELAKRKFVLWPLSDIAPRWRDPHSGHRIHTLRRSLKDPSQQIRRYPRGRP